jgi:hypothetical protein
MTKLEKYAFWIKAVFIVCVYQEMLLLTFSTIALIKGRTDWACYMLILSMFLTGQFLGMHSSLCRMYNSLLQEEERKHLF